MDNYTKMCSQLQELQDNYPIGNTGEIFYHENGEKYWLPSLEQLIGMLEGKYFMIEHLSDPDTPENWFWELSSNKICEDGLSLKILMLKLVAFELWDKTWNADKEVWEEG